MDQPQLDLVKGASRPFSDEDKHLIKAQHKENIIMHNLKKIKGLRLLSIRHTKINTLTLLLLNGVLAMNNAKVCELLNTLM